MSGEPRNPTAGHACPAVFGEVLFDCFPDGSRVLGGAPFNVAWHLQAFGLDPVLISAIGDDPMGGAIRETMARWGLSTRGLQLDPDHATGEVQVHLEHGQPRFDIVDQRAYDRIRTERLPELDVSIVYHGTLALRHPCSTGALDALLERCRAPVFLDVNLRAPWWDRDLLSQRLDRARWVKLNHDELLVLDDAAGDPPTRAARLLERHAIDTVIVTLGEDGAFLVDRAGTLVRAPRADAARVVDTVGAGDAFAAVCLLGLVRGWPLDTLMARAQQFASRIVEQRGATAEDHSLYASLIGSWATPNA